MAEIWNIYETCSKWYLDKNLWNVAFTGLYYVYVYIPRSFSVRNFLTSPVSVTNRKVFCWHLDANFRPCYSSQNVILQILFISSGFLSQYSMQLLSAYEQIHVSISLFDLSSSLRRMKRKFFWLNVDTLNVTKHLTSSDWHAGSLSETGNWIRCFAMW
jgi:hypothetical protein